MTDLLYKDESYRLIGACMEVHKKMGTGFLEPVYQEALEKEFGIREVPFIKQKKLELYYNEEKLKKYYVADFICFDQIIVELKALPFISKNDERQLLNYLKATKYSLGILVNFGEPSLKYRRLINTSRNSS
jgi:GxxExxY protein